MLFILCFQATYTEILPAKCDRFLVNSQRCNALQNSAIYVCCCQFTVFNASVPLYWICRLCFYTVLGLVMIKKILID